MKTKTKLLLTLLCAVALTAAFFALRAFFPSDKYRDDLSVPQNVRIDGTYLRWQKSSYANGYNVKIGGEIRFSATTELRLEYNDNGKFVSVCALSSYKNPSEYSQEFKVEFSPNVMQTTKTVTYTLEKLNLSRTEFIFSGVPVSIESEDFTEYGYEFVCWYYYSNGEKKVLNSPQLFWENVTLYAEVKAISYPVTFIPAQGFPLPDNLPETYTVETIADICALSNVYEGYKTDGWNIGSAEGKPLLSTDFVTGAITLYPRISLINGGLRFIKCGGGYALSLFCGTEENLFVPKYFKGERVVKVLRGAINGKEAPNLKSITFYGDVMLEEFALAAMPSLENLTFCGDITGERGAIVCADDSFNDSANTLKITVIGVPPETDGFISGYLGMKPTSRVLIYVNEEYFAACVKNYNGCEVFVSD